MTAKAFMGVICSLSPSNHTHKTTPKPTQPPKTKTPSAYGSTAPHWKPRSSTLRHFQIAQSAQFITPLATILLVNKAIS
jgi:hypothetical protein